MVPFIMPVLEEPVIDLLFRHKIAIFSLLLVVYNNYSDAIDLLKLFTLSQLFVEDPRKLLLPDEWRNRHKSDNLQLDILAQSN